MRFFRGLPPFLRVVWVVGLLFPVASFLLLILLNLYWSPFHVSQANFGHTVGIVLNLAMLGWACSVVAGAYNARLRQPGRRRQIPLDSWQRQALAIALLAALPLCAIILAAVIPPNQIAFMVVFPITWIGALVQLIMWLLVLG